jgi:hypothetical protein
MNAFKAIVFGLVTLVPISGTLAAETHSAQVGQLRTAQQKVARAAGATKAAPAICSSKSSNGSGHSSRISSRGRPSIRSRSIGRSSAPSVADCEPSAARGRPTGSGEQSALVGLLAVARGERLAGAA